MSRWLRGNAVIWALVIVAVVMAALLLGVFRAYQSATLQLLHERDQQVAFLSAARLKEELTRYAGALTDLSHNPAINQGSDSQRHLALLAARPRLAVFDGGVAVLDTFGQVQATLGGQSDVVGRDWSEHDYFRAQIGAPGISLSDIHDDGPVAGPLVALSVPMVNAEGEFAGVLVGFFRLGESAVSALYASIVRLRMGQSGTTYLVDGQGDIIYDSDYGPPGGPLAERGPQGLGGLHRAGTLRTRDGEGHDILVAYAPLPGTSWSLVVEDDWEALTAPIRRYRQLLLGLLVATLATPVIGLAWAVQRRRLSPEADQDFDGGSAGGLQRALAPRQLPMIPGWSLALHVQPGRDGTRDYLDVEFLPDGRLALLMARLPATDRRAAHVASLLHAGLHRAAHSGLSTTAALGEVHALLGPAVAADGGTPCLWLLLDPLTGHLAMANAAYPTPRHVGSDVNDGDAAAARWAAAGQPGPRHVGPSGDPDPSWRLLHRRQRRGPRCRRR